MEAQELKSVPAVTNEIVKTRISDGETHYKNKPSALLIGRALEWHFNQIKKLVNDNCYESPEITETLKSLGHTRDELFLSVAKDWVY